MKRQNHPSKPILQLEDAFVVRRQNNIGFELHIPELQLRSGHCVGLVGTSGCGKSTLLDLLALLLRPTRCTTFALHGSSSHDLRSLWENNDDRALAALRRDCLGYVMQTGGLLPFLSVAANITLPARLRGIRPARRDLMQQAEALGIAAVLDKKPQHLSGGQRQRVAILRALINDPLLVLADEPTAAVDAPRARRIAADFRQLALQRGTAMIVASHDLKLIDALADTLYGFKVAGVSARLTRSRCLRIR